MTNANDSVRPIWPSDMEPGNIYFVVESGFEQDAPIMVSASSGQEAVARVQAARANDRYLRPPPINSWQAGSALARPGEL